MTKREKIRCALMALAVIAVVALDQFTKYLVVQNIRLGGDLPFIPGFIGFTYVQNTGAAFSILNTHTWMLAVLSGAASVLIGVALARKALPHWSGMLALSLLLGGAVGNLIDRAFFGFVTDMFATTFMNFAVFNVADIGVTLGAVLLLLHVIFFYNRGKEGTK